MQVSQGLDALARSAGFLSAGQLSQSIAQAHMLEELEARAKFEKSIGCAAVGCSDTINAMSRGLAEANIYAGTITAERMAAEWFLAHLQKPTANFLADEYAKLSGAQSVASLRDFDVLGTAARNIDTLQALTGGAAAALALSKKHDGISEFLNSSGYEELTRSVKPNYLAEFAAVVQPPVIFQPRPSHPELIEFSRPPIVGKSVAQLLAEQGSKQESKQDARHREHLALVERLAHEKAEKDERGQSTAQRIELLKWLGGIAITAWIFLLSQSFIFG